MQDNTNEISEKELLDAAQRCFDGGFDTQFATAKDYYKSDLRAKDTDAISRFVISELKRRQAERAEREKPIDAEWFRKHGNEVCSIFVCRDDVEYEIEWAAGTPGIGVDLTVYSGPRKCFCHSVNLRHITTRGQLLDLLAALKGGAS